MVVFYRFMADFMKVALNITHLIFTLFLLLLFLHVPAPLAIPGLTQPLWVQARRPSVRALTIPSARPPWR